MIADLVTSTALGGVDGWACAPWCVVVATLLAVAGVVACRRAIDAAERDLRARESATPTPAPSRTDAPR